MTDHATMGPPVWKPLNTETPTHVPIVVAKLIQSEEGVGWSFQSYDYAVAAYQEDGELVAWNGGEPLSGYTLWCEVTPP